MLSSLRPDYRAVVFGASGGIGSALAGLLVGDQRCAHVYLGSRSGDAPACAGRQAKVSSFAFDLLDEDSVAHVGEEIGRDGAVDLVLVATGFLHGDGVQPEKSWRALHADAFGRSFALNATGPAMIPKHMLGRLNGEHKSVFAALSARVGSISDNRLGGWHAYRASKAALNMIIKTLSVELAVRNEAGVCVGLHPGTVRTDLSAPFVGGRRNVMAPEQTARRLLSVVDGLGAAESGRCFDFEGREVEP